MPTQSSAPLPLAGKGLGWGVSAKARELSTQSERADRAAKRLRRDATFVERELWKALRPVKSVHSGARRRSALCVDFAVIALA